MLVIGQPALGLVRVEAVAGRWRVADLTVPDRPDADDLAHYLLDAALGMALDRGATRVAVPTASGTEERSLADEPAPRPAVSVIPLRERAGRLEVFVQHRVATMDAFAGVVVFPGGRVDDADAAAGAALDLLDAHARRWAATPHDPRTLLATGIRELAEETGAVVDPARLVPWDNWITPIGYRRRFDVAFFLLPDADDAHVHATTEASASEWLTLDDLVARTEAGHVAMVPPTRTLVDELHRLGSIDAALAVAGASGPIEPVRHDVSGPRPRRAP